VGNYEFLAYVEDRDEPRTGSDRFWIEVIDGMVMSSPADGNAVEIEGGNIVVPHGGGGSKR
jgi:hypothetical protein